MTRLRNRGIHPILDHISRTANLVIELLCSAMGEKIFWR